MAHDSSNPFARLAGLFPAKDGGRDPAKPGQTQTGAGKGPGSLAAGGARSGAPGRTRAQNEPGPTDADAALFLNAMSNTRPLPGAAGAKDDKGRGGKGKRGNRSGAADPFRGTVAGDGARPPDDEAVFFAQNALFAGAAPLPGRSAGQAHAERAARGERKGTRELSRGTFAVPERDGGVSPSSQTPLQAEQPQAGARGSAEDGAEDALFFKAMQGVLPVTTKGRELALSGKSAPGSLADKAQPAPDPAQALRDFLEGRVEFALHNTDEYMEGFVVGVDPLVLGRLRAGQYSPEAHVDLHGQNAQQALDSLTWFIKNAYQRGLRTVIVVTGRGKNSPDGVGVLRPMLSQWLSKDPFKRVVLAFCTAQASDGGPGALYVLLRKYKKSRGKIVWEHSPSDDGFLEP